MPLCCLVIITIFALSGCNGSETKSRFPEGSIINTAKTVDISNKQIQKINELLNVLVLSTPDTGYYDEIQAIAPNEDLKEFSITQQPNDDEKYDFRGKYGLNVYKSGKGYYVFIYSLCNIDNNPFVEKNKCLGYLYVDLVLDSDVVTNAKTIGDIKNSNPDFSVSNRYKYDMDITLKRTGNPSKYEDAIHAMFVTDKGLYVISYEKDEFDSQMNRVPKENAKILDVEKIEGVVLSEVCKLILAD